MTAIITDNWLCQSSALHWAVWVESLIFGKVGTRYHQKQSC